MRRIVIRLPGPPSVYVMNQVIGDDMCIATSYVDQHGVIRNPGGSAPHYDVLRVLSLRSGTYVTSILNAITDLSDHFAFSKLSLWDTVINILYVS
jgi:hypothetical protein